MRASRSARAKPPNHTIKKNDVLVERLLSACVAVTDDEKAHEQQDSQDYEGERAELSIERKRRRNADNHRENEDRLGNKSDIYLSIGGLFGHKLRSRTMKR